MDGPSRKRVSEGAPSQRITPLITTRKKWFCYGNKIRDNKWFFLLLQPKILLQQPNVLLIELNILLF